MIQPVIVQSPLGDDPPTATLYYGVDCRESLRRLPDQSIHTVCTSPPYWGLRNYCNDPSIWCGDRDCDHDWSDTIPDSNKGGSGTPTDKNNRGEGYGRGEPRGQYCTKCDAWLGQLGLEPSPDEFVSHLVEIFSDVKRVLRDDGTLWLNLGDSYANPGIQSFALSSTGERIKAGKKDTMNSALRAISDGIKYKDLVGIPWAVAFALRADGWYLRSDIIWAKANCMPESVQDRPTRSHEYVFLLTKSEKYYYDVDAIREPHQDDSQARMLRGRSKKHKLVDGPGHQSLNTNDGLANGCHPNGRNKRTVWQVNSQSYHGSHFAVWPLKLVEPMILAGTGDKGCCATCGTAYKRVVNREGTESIKQSYKGEKSDHWKGLQSIGRNGGFVGGFSDTKGWEPGCECGDQSTKRCVVLDPFSGSATTGKVANDHGRDYIGMDASTEYLDLAIARLQDRVAPPSDNTPEESSVMDLFG